MLLGLVVVYVLNWLHMEQVGSDDSSSHGSSFVHDLCFRAPRSQMVPQKSRRP